MRKQESNVKTMHQIISFHFLIDVLDALDDPVFVKDQDHLLVFFNDSACKAIGRPRDELIGKSDMEENLKHRIKMESLVGDISKHLISLPPDEIDRGIAYALQMAGEFVGVERSYIFQFVQGIVNQSGGNIKVYSKPNQGTTFEIHFPM